MIIGVGCDIIEMQRIEELLENTRFINKVLHPEEIKELNKLTEKQKITFVAGRFAAKEAFSKAYGTGIGDELSWRDIKVLNNSKGGPYITSNKLKVNESAHISISHEKRYAIAYCMIEKIII